jgi:hypothetical protein
VLCACSRAELAEFGEPDFVIYNGGAFPANKVRGVAAGATSQQAHLNTVCRYIATGVNVGATSSTLTMCSTTAFRCVLHNQRAVGKPGHVRPKCLIADAHVFCRIAQRRPLHSNNVYLLLTAGSAAATAINPTAATVFCSTTTL